MNTNDLIIIYIIILILVAILVLNFAIKYVRYKKSTYYLQTKYSYWSVMNDKGRNGEYELYQQLRSFEAIGCRFLFNLYIPKENGKTTEVDMIMFHPKGLFVIESKNYSGWIFGNGNNNQWTQTLPVRYGESHKEHFYNPILQNNTHIKTIKRYINNAIPIYSVIAFSDECTLKNITIDSNIILDYYSNVKTCIISKILEVNDLNIDVTLLNEAYTTLLAYANVSDAIRENHILDLK